jgi:hypothetical protein
MAVIGRMNVHKRQGLFILINFLAVAGSGDDLTEDAFTRAHVNLARLRVLPAQLWAPIRHRNTDFTAVSR